MRTASRFHVDFSPFTAPDTTPKSFLHIWLLDTHSLADEVLTVNTGLLSIPEKARAQQFKRQQRDFLATRVMMRKCLSQYLPTPAADLVFATAAMGKPYIPDQQLHFNLSHSGGLAALAVSDARVGIDIELVRPRNYLAIANNFFHPDEQAQLGSKAPDELASWFFRYWTLKEAFVKATGGGIVTGLEKLNFNLANEEIKLKLSPGIQEQAENWSFLQQQLTTTGWLGLASEGSRLPAIHWHCANELLSTPSHG